MNKIHTTKIKYPFAILFLAGASLFAISCDDNEEIIADPNAEYDAILEVKEDARGNPNQNVTINADAITAIKAKVSVTSTAKSMTRLYITQNIKGEGETIYKPTEDLDLKGDGSVDIESSKKNLFDYTFTLPVPSDIEGGTVVYKFWTTDGIGDFRDITKRIAVGPGTITLNYGAATNAKTGTALLKKYSAKILAPPAADSSSLTFISLIDGHVYKINEGAEYAKRWDFGYWYGNAGASLASTAIYETMFPFVDVDGIAGTSDLNNIYFRLTTKTLADFNAAEFASDLIFTTVANQNISRLVAGNVIEFIDNYGKKGLIYIVEVKGTFNQGDYIKINIKVQP